MSSSKPLIRSRKAHIVLIMILITGGGGYLGLNIALSLARAEQDVLLMQRHALQRPSWLAEFWDKQIRQANGSVLDFPFLIGTIRDYGVESIIHGAFDTRGIRSAASLKSGLHQMIQTELQGTVNVLEAARNAGIRRVTFISSLDCYRGRPQECTEWQEDAFLPPFTYSPIGAVKRAAEQVGFLYSSTYDLKFVALRVGRAYGPPGTHPGPIREMVESAVSGRAAQLGAVAASVRSHTVYVEDVGEAVRLIHTAEAPRYTIYNLADGSNPTMLEVARTLQKVVPGAEITLGPGKDEHPLHSGVDVSRAREEFGFTFRKLESGLEDYCVWLRQSQRVR